MPLELLAGMVVVGLALVIGAVHLSGLSKVARIAGPDAAIARFLVDFPDEKPGEAVVSADGKDAFIALDGNRVGMVHAIGDRYLTRILRAGMVRSVSASGNGEVELRLADFTLPRERARFATAGEASCVENWLKGMANA
jgi:hypothetical protein